PRAERRTGDSGRSPATQLPALLPGAPAGRVALPEGGPRQLRASGARRVRVHGRNGAARSGGRRSRARGGAVVHGRRGGPVGPSGGGAARTAARGDRRPRGDRG